MTPIEVMLFGAMCLATTAPAAAVLKSVSHPSSSRIPLSCPVVLENTTMTPSPVGRPKARLLENPPSAILTTKYLLEGSEPFMNPDLMHASSSYLPVSSNGPR